MYTVSLLLPLLWLMKRDKLYYCTYLSPLPSLSMLPQPLPTSFSASVSLLLSSLTLLYYMNILPVYGFVSSCY